MTIGFAPTSTDLAHLAAANGFDPTMRCTWLAESRAVRRGLGLIRVLGEAVIICIECNWRQAWGKLESVPGTVVVRHGRRRTDLAVNGKTAVATQGADEDGFFICGFVCEACKQSVYGVANSTAGPGDDAECAIGDCLEKG